MQYLNFLFQFLNKNFEYFYVYLFLVITNKAQQLPDSKKNPQNVNKFVLQKGNLKAFYKVIWLAFTQKKILDILGLYELSKLIFVGLSADHFFFPSFLCHVPVSLTSSEFQKHCFLKIVLVVLLVGFYPSTFADLRLS